MFLQDFSFKISVFYSVFSMLKNVMQHSEQLILLFLQLDFFLLVASTCSTIS